MVINSKGQESVFCQTKESIDAFRIKLWNFKCAHRSLFVPWRTVLGCIPSSVSGHFFLLGLFSGAAEFGIQWRPEFGS